MSGSISECREFCEFDAWFAEIFAGLQPNVATPVAIEESSPPPNDTELLELTNLPTDPSGDDRWLSHLIEEACEKLDGSNLELLRYV